jgi:hypothetical protein
MHKEEYSRSYIDSFPEVIAMTVETNLQPRKAWVAPSLKKIDIQEFTANYPFNKPKPDKTVGESGFSS